MLMAVLAALLTTTTGCEWFSRAKGEGEKGAGEPGAGLSSKEIAARCQSRLAVIEVTWEEASSLLGRWTRRGRVGIGVVIASDGHNALVYTNRRLVDPRYQRGRLVRTRNSSFRVSTPQGAAARPFTDGRLVAVYTNGDDLALLRVPFSGEPFAISPAETDALAADAPVAVFGLPDGSAFTQRQGKVVAPPTSPEQAEGRFSVSVSGGPVSDIAAVFTAKDGKFAGLVAPGRERRDIATVLPVTSADQLGKNGCWNCLIDPSLTLGLLSTIK